MGFLDLNEKVGLLIKAALIFILGFIIMIFSNNIILRKMNKTYIEQNTAVIGALASENINLDKVIPIMTKGDLTYIDKGKEILNKYSYNLKTNIKNNSILNKSVNESYVIIGGLYSFFALLVLFYIGRMGVFIINNIKYLTKKAEYIVEGKAIEEKFEERFKVNFKGKGEFNSFIDLNYQFDLMNQRIESSIESLREEKVNLKNIINDITHQFKTPIAAVSMYNDILKKKHSEMDNEEREYFLNLTEEQIERMNWLTKTLLKYARIESNVVEYKKEIQSFSTTVKNTIKILEHRAKENDVFISFESNKEDIVFNHDRKWMEEAILNIIKNAIEHSGKNKKVKNGANEEGKVEVSLYENDILMRLEIKDNGEGINEKDIKKIFNRFHKGSNSINPKSIGIGLSLSKSIIESNGGTIKVKSILGEESIFIITFIKAYS